MKIKIVEQYATYGNKNKFFVYVDNQCIKVCETEKEAMDLIPNLKYGLGMEPRTVYEEEFKIDAEG